jgi:hypothetical protein
MENFHDDPLTLPAPVREAIQRLIDKANDSDLPIVDVAESAAELVAKVPEAAELGLERLRDAIAHTAARDSRVGLSINRVA